MNVVRWWWVAMACVLVGASFRLPAAEPETAWMEKIRSKIPSKARVKPASTRKALLFSVMTGYQHDVTPYTAAVVKMLGEKSGAFDVVESDDVDVFLPERIKSFDLIVLNNNCSKRDHRNLFLDVTGDAEKAERLEQSLIAHIADGHGLVVLHGGIAMQNHSMAFSEMVGGSFDFHPRLQQVTCKLVDPDHPLVARFEGKPFVHQDEPYLFNKAYARLDFRPLLEMDTSKLQSGKKADAVRSMARYVAWIKRHGKGRVFFCSPSHSRDSYEVPGLLEFMLAGIQYAAGDLECDDSPVGK